MTTDTPPADPGRQLDPNTILTAYSDRLAATTRDLVLAQAVAQAAEAECAQLRLRVVELEEAARPQKR